MMGRIYAMVVRPPTSSAGLSEKERMTNKTTKKMDAATRGEKERFIKYRPTTNSKRMTPLKMSAMESGFQVPVRVLEITAATVPTKPATPVLNNKMLKS